MKLFETNHSFSYPWEQVTAANWLKYPNKFSTHVVSVDILARLIDIPRQTLRTERLIGCKQAIPNWLSWIVGSEQYSYVREVSEVDLINKTLVMMSSNLTMNHLLLVNETVVYRPGPLNTTTFTQSAEITAFKMMSKICDKVEEWSVERFGQNAKLGKVAFESVLGALSEKWDEIDQQVVETTSEVLQEVEKLSRIAGLAVVETTEQIGKGWAGK